MINRTVYIDNNKFHLHIYPQIIARVLIQAEGEGKQDIFYIIHFQPRIMHF